MNHRSACIRSKAVYIDDKIGLVDGKMFVRCTVLKGFLFKSVLIKSLSLLGEYRGFNPHYYLGLR